LWVIEFGDDNSDTEHVRLHYALSLEKFQTGGAVKAYAWAWQTRSASNEAFNIYNGASPDPAYYELAKYPASGTTTPTTPTSTLTPTTTPTQTPTLSSTPTATSTPTPTASATSKPSSSTALSYPADGEITYGRTTSAYMPWTRKEAVVPAFMALADQYGGTYESIGKSSGSENWDIIIFKFGNPNGAPIMIDAQLHGNEYYGYELMYSLATWLLTSNDAEANRILQNNYVLFVPVVDYRWGRTNYNSPSWMTTLDPSTDGGTCGVNLNRNFSPGWSSSLSTSDSDSYSGVSADREKESQALINAWNTYHPRIYWDLHQGASPTTMCSATTTQARTDANKVLSLLPSIQSSLGVSSGWSFSVGGGSGGYAKDGAAKAGCAGFLTEVMNGWDNAASKLADLTSGNTFKQAKAMFIAMCQAIEGPNTVPTPTSTPQPTVSPTPASSTVPTSSPTPAVSPTPSSGDGSFEDGFETGTCNAWTSTAVSCGESASVTGNAYSGSYSAQFTGNGNGGYEKAFVYERFTTPKNFVDVQGYFRLAQDGTVKNNDRIKFVELRAGTTIVAAAGLWQSNGKLYWWIETRSGSGYVETRTAVAGDVSQWFSLELVWTCDGSNGGGVLLVNGTPVYQISNSDTNNFGGCTQVNIGLAELYTNAPSLAYADQISIS
jgi:predicted deacylase